MCKNRKFVHFIAIILCITAVCSLFSTSFGEKAETFSPIIEPQQIADYIFANGQLPDNFITKREAQSMGWDSSRNYVSDVAPGMSIGGDRFGNYEGILPEKKGRQYYEADAGYVKGRRSAKRIIFSNDGLVFYTEDHYQSFTELHPSPITSPQAVADYISQNGTLPPNFITKKEAQSQGWKSSLSLSDILPGMSIGGDTFDNREKLLPVKKGRKYYQADCGYVSGKRNSHRLVYSSDGLFYYTEDNFKSFTEIHPTKEK